MKTDERDRFHAIMESDDPASATVKQHLLGIGDDNVRQGLTLLRELSQEHGFKVLIGMWPLFDETGIYQVESSDPERLVPVPPGETLRVEKLALENRLSTFRFGPPFIRDYQRRQEEEGPAWNQNPMDFYCDGDPMHPNPTASEVAAETIAAFLKSYPEFLRRPLPTPKPE